MNPDMHTPNPILGRLRSSQFMVDDDGDSSAGSDTADGGYGEGIYGASYRAPTPTDAGTRGTAATATEINLKTHTNNYQLRGRHNSDAGDLVDSRPTVAAHASSSSSAAAAAAVGSSSGVKDFDTNTMGSSPYSYARLRKAAESQSHDHDDVGVHASFYSRFSRQQAKMEKPEPVVAKVRKGCAFSVLVAIALLLAMVVFSGNVATLDDEPDPVLPPVPLPNLAADRLRPQFHLLPPMNWMNDPCGPVFTQSAGGGTGGGEDSGTFHLFYQCNPYAAQWGAVHWCHATSPDSVMWTNVPIALAPGTGPPGEFPAPRPTGAPTLMPTGDAPTVTASHSSDSASAAPSEQAQAGVLDAAAAGATWAPDVRLRRDGASTVQPPATYDSAGVFSGSVLLGGLVNNSYVPASFLPSCPPGVHPY